jgi:hypothetical protein
MKLFLSESDIVALMDNELDLENNTNNPFDQLRKYNDGLIFIGFTFYCSISKPTHDTIICLYSFFSPASNVVDGFLNFTCKSIFVFLVGDQYRPRAIEYLPLLITPHLTELEIPFMACGKLDQRKKDTHLSISLLGDFRNNSLHDFVAWSR